MLTPLENGIGLDIVIWFQQHGNGLFDLLAELLNVTGGSLFLLLVGPLFYWATAKRLGQHMLVLLLVGTLTVVTAKQLAHTPRPYVAHPDDVTPLFEETGYGMPSGHVLNAIVFWFPVGLWLGIQRWRWLLGGYVLLTMWSRMYAGVHYPQDTLGGLILGLGIVGIYYARIEHTAEHPPPIRLESRWWLALAALLPIPLTALFWHYEDGLIVTGALVGALTGMWIEARYLQFDTSAPLKTRAWRYATGVIVLLALYAGLKIALDPLDLEPVFRVVRYGVLTLFVVAGWPWLWRRIAVLH